MATLKVTGAQLADLISPLIDNNLELLNQIAIQDIEFVYVFYILINAHQRRATSMKQAFIVHRNVDNRKRVSAYGSNNWGILSLGTNEIYDRTFSNDVQSLSSLNITQLASGHFHALALTEERSVYSWGRNNCGQLGIPWLGIDTEECPNPELVMFPTSDQEKPVLIQSIACGDDFSLALAQDTHQVFLWGRNHCTPNQILLDAGPEATHLTLIESPCQLIFNGIERDPIINVRGSEKNHYALTNTGRLLSRGSDDAGQLGRGVQSEEVELDYERLRVSQVCPEQRMCVILASNNSLWCWGAVSRNPAPAPREVPFSRRHAKLVPIIENAAIMINIRDTVVIRSRFSLEVTQDLSAKGHKGPSFRGLLQIGSVRVTIRVADMGDFGGSTELWYEDRDLVLKMNETKLRKINPHFHPFRRQNSRFIQQFHVGEGKTKQYLIVLDSDQVFAYGSNDDGILATGDQNPILNTNPRLIEYLSNKKIIDFASSTQHVLALTANGQVWSWGWNGFGQLGRETETDQDFVPRLVVFEQKDVKIKKIACGMWFSLAMADDEKTLFAWGDNESGQLGNETLDSTTAPSQVQLDLDQSDFIDEIHGGSHTVLIRTKNGRLFGCGSNEYGTVGIGSEDQNVTRPVRIPFEPESTKVKMSACVGGIAAVVDENGRLWVWGGSEPESAIRSPQQIEFAEQITKMLATVDDIALLTDREDVYLIKAESSPLQPEKLPGQNPPESLLVDQPLNIKIELVDIAQQVKDDERLLTELGGGEEASTSAS